MVVADLPGSEGEAVAKEMGDNATFVATDVSTHTSRLCTLTLTCIHLCSLLLGNLKFEMAQIFLGDYNSHKVARVGIAD